MGLPRKGRKGFKRPSKGRKVNQKSKGRNKRPPEVYNDRDRIKKQKVHNNINTLNKHSSEGEIHSSDSESENDNDPFMNLLTEFDVNVNNKARDSDTEDEESEVSETNSDQLGDVNMDVTSDLAQFSDINASGEENATREDGNSDGNSDDFESDEEEVDDYKDTNGQDDSSDPFVRHLRFDLHPDLLKSLTGSLVADTAQEHWPKLGNIHFSIPKPIEQTVSRPRVILQDDISYADTGTVPCIIKSVDWTKLHVKSQIQGNLKEANCMNLKGTDSELTSLQRELFTIINNYQDLYCPLESFENNEEIRFIYCLHAVNHVLKTRLKIVHHNARLLNKDDVPEDFRDQGLARPKVLILVPFRHSALKVIKMIISILLPDEKANVMNKGRFFEEYTGNEIVMPYKNPRPEDYEKTFSGNTDDSFKIGLSVTKKSIKLYADFYSSDIIVASPLGLRMLIGAEGEEHRDHDFLVSIEMLILDQTEIFIMQNWDHVLHIMNHLHLQPKEDHGTNFARVRSWAVNGLTCYYRQTLVFSSLTLPEINSLFNKKCKNYAGKGRVVQNTLKGTVCQVVVQLPQVFQKFSIVQSIAPIDTRFEFFTKKILPDFVDFNTHNVLVYVPSYFDYVRIRNYFKRENISFVQICEYSKENKIARARDLFFHNEVQFLLYSERAHYFRRFRIKGISHLIFYQPPTIPHFYSEMCNFINENNSNKSGVAKSNDSVTIIYSKFDGLQLAAIVGSERASRMLASERDTHMFVSGE